VLATNFVGLAEPRAGSTELTSTRPYSASSGPRDIGDSYAAVLDRLGRYEPAATIAGFAEVNPFATTAFPGLGTAVTHQRNVLGDETYESLARKGETMSTTAMATYVLDQIDQARAELRAVSKIDHIRDVPDRHPRHRICQVVASQKFVSEEAVAISRHSAHATYVSECVH
jgi:hypothetical protein